MEDGGEMLAEIIYIEGVLLAQKARIDIVNEVM